MPILDNKHDDDAFLPTLLSYLTPVMKKDFEDEKIKKEMGESIIKVLSGEDVKPIVSAKKKTKDLIFLGTVFRHYLEISSSIERMFTISIFVRQYPSYKSYKKYDITPTKYLRYHTENYFNEVYLFRQRFVRFLGFLKNECNNKRLPKEKKILDRIKNQMLSALDGLSKTRSSHVHGRNRYTNNKFERLELYELLTKQEDLKILSVLKKINYRSIRQEWYKKISKNNELLDKFLDEALEKLKPIIFKKMLPLY